MAIDIDFETNEFGMSPDQAAVNQDFGGDGPGAPGMGFFPFVTAALPTINRYLGGQSAAPVASAPRPVVRPAPAKGGMTTQKILLWGGIALAAIVIVPMLLKKRR
jgi:hypothetical protein